MGPSVAVIPCVPLCRVDHRVPASFLDKNAAVFSLCTEEVINYICILSRWATECLSSEYPRPISFNLNSPVKHKRPCHRSRMFLFRPSASTMHTPIVDLVLWFTFLFSTSFSALLFNLPFRSKSPFGKPKPCLLDACQLRQVLAIYSLRPHDLGPVVAHELSKIVRTPSYTPTMEEMAELAMRSYVKELKRCEWVFFKCMYQYPHGGCGGVLKNWRRLQVRPRHGRGQSCRGKVCTA